MVLLVYLCSYFIEATPAIMNFRKKERQTSSAVSKCIMPGPIFTCSSVQSVCSCLSYASLFRTRTKAILFDQLRSTYPKSQPQLSHHHLHNPRCHCHCRCHCSCNCRCYCRSTCPYLLVTIVNFTTLDVATAHITAIPIVVAPPRRPPAEIFLD